MGHLVNMVCRLKLDGKLSRGKTGENSTSVPSPTEAEIAITLVSNNVCVESAPSMRLVVPHFS